MSRSYKKVGGWVDKNKFMKKYANRVVRRYKLEVPSGMAYKKYFQSYTISDFKFLYFSIKEYKKEKLLFQRNKLLVDVEPVYRAFRK